ncbi:MAG: hypothetical protein IT460_05060 [Planctomycetes bacterium]|nr:hypothetical protein [Planctomycetota bacterium]
MDDDGGEQPIDLTGRACRRIAADVRSVFARLGIAIDATPIGDDVTEVEWLGTAAGPVATLLDDSRVDRERFVAAFAKAVRARRVARALALCEGVRGFQTVLRHLKNLRLGAASGEATQAWDQLLEVEIAAAASGADLPVEFAEPDLRISDGEAWYSVACKRPASEESVPGALAKAIRQIERYPFPGVAIISAERFIAHPSPTLSAAEVQRAYRTQLERLNRRLHDAQRSSAWGAEAHSPPFGGITVAAVLVYSTLTVYQEERRGVQTAFVAYDSVAVRNRGLTGRPWRRLGPFLGAFQLTLKRGHRRLVAHVAD